MAFIKASDAAKAAADLTASLTGGKGNVAAESAAASMERLMTQAKSAEAKAAAAMFAPGLDKEAITSDREQQAMKWKHAAADRASKVRLMARAILAQAVDATTLNPVEAKGQKLCDSKRASLAAYRETLGGYLKRCGITDPNTTFATDRGITVSGWLDAFVLATRAMAMTQMIAAAGSDAKAAA
jgi:hypothetical protein